MFDHTESLATTAREGLDEVFIEAGVTAHALGISSLVVPVFGLESRPKSPGDVAVAGDKRALTQFHRRLLDYGFYFNPGSMGNVSYAMAEAHVESFLTAARDVVKEMQTDGVI